MQSLHSPGVNVLEDYDSHLFNRICYSVGKILIYSQGKVFTLTVSIQNGNFQRENNLYKYPSTQMFEEHLGLGLITSFSKFLLSYKVVVMQYHYFLF